MKSKKRKDDLEGVLENIPPPWKENIPRFGKCSEGSQSVPKMERRKQREVGRNRGGDGG